MTCPYCHSLPHRPGCPNAPEEKPKGVYECAYCGNMINEGEEFYNIGAEFYHSDCVSEALSVYDVLEAFGIHEEIAISEGYNE